jgi:hypothetical protein
MWVEYNQSVEQNLQVPQNQALSEPAMSDGALRGALCVQNQPSEQPPKDPDLALIQDCWPNLPQHIKAAITTLVRSAIGK